MSGFGGGGGAHAARPPSAVRGLVFPPHESTKRGAQREASRSRQSADADGEAEAETETFSEQKKPNKPLYNSKPNYSEYYSYSGIPFQ